MARRGGFSLAETLVVMAVFGVMAGTLCLRPPVANEDAAAVRAEAEALAEWLSGKMTRARLEGRGFRLEAPHSGDGMEIKHIKLTRNGSGGDAAAAEYYRAEGAVLEIFSGTLPSYVYDSGWHTLAPAVTINLKSKRSPSKVLYTVTVSGQGYVAVRTPRGMPAEGA